MRVPATACRAPDGCTKARRRQRRQSLGSHLPLRLEGVYVPITKRPVSAVKLTLSARVEVGADVIAELGAQPRERFSAELLLAALFAHVKGGGGVGVQDEVVVLNEVIIAIQGREACLVARSRVIRRHLRVGWRPVSMGLCDAKGQRAPRACGCRTSMFGMSDRSARSLWSRTTRCFAPVVYCTSPPGTYPHVNLLA